MLAVFSAPALPAATAGVPRTGRRVQSNSTILACAVEIGQTKVDSKAFPCVPPCVPVVHLCLAAASALWFPRFCAKIPPNLSEEPKHEAHSHRFPVLARSHSVRLRAGEEVPYEKGCRPRP